MHDEDWPGSPTVKLNEGENSKGDKSMFCTNCGNQIDSTMAFCTKCGTPVGGGRPAQVVQCEIKNHLVGAILQTVVCIPAGIVPLIYACKVNSKLAQGDVVGAQEASRKAKFWLNLTTAIFGAIIILWILMAALGPAVSKAAKKARQATENARQQRLEQNGNY